MITAAQQKQELEVNIVRVAHLLRIAEKAMHSGKPGYPASEAPRLTAELDDLLDKHFMACLMAAGNPEPQQE